MVIRLPDMGKVPGNGGDPNATLISQIHNGLLEGAVARLRARFQTFASSCRTGPVVRGPVNADGPECSAHRAFSPTAPERAACLFLNPASCVDMPAFLFNNLNVPFLFWDIVHPTTLAHRFLGDYMFNLLQAE